NTAKQNPDPSLFIAPFVMSPSDPARLYVGTDALYRSTNSGGQFSQFSPHFPLQNSGFSCCISAVAEAPSNPNVVYAGMDNGRIEVTTNGGGNVVGNWSDKSPSPFPARFVTDIVVDPTNANVVYASVSGFGTPHVFKSTNAGGSWASIS